MAWFISESFGHKHAYQNFSCGETLLVLQALWQKQRWNRYKKRYAGAYAGVCALLSQCTNVKKKKTPTLFVHIFASFQSAAADGGFLVSDYTL